MKILTMVIVLSALTAEAQDKYYEPRSPIRQVTITLSPIVIQNGKYFFEGRRVRYEDVGLYLRAINDKKIDQRLKIIGTLTDLRTAVILVPTAYLWYSLHNPPNTYNAILSNFYTFLGMFAFEMLYDASIAVTKRSAINRYNEVLLQPSASILPGSGVSLGFKIKF